MNEAGPMHSVIASGRFGDVVYQKNGIIRVFVPPSNPQSTPQMDQRQKVSVSAKGSGVIGPLAEADIRASRLMKGHKEYHWSGYLMTAIRNQINAGSYSSFALLSGSGRISWNFEAALGLGVQFTTLPNTTIETIQPGEAIWSLALALWGSEIGVGPGQPDANNAVAWRVYIASVGTLSIGEPRGTLGGVYAEEIPGAL